MDSISSKKARRGDLTLVKPASHTIIIPLPAERNEGWYLNYGKRATDILISSVLILAVLSWLYPVLYVIIRLTSNGPALFIQKRVGLNGKVFSCLKLRTMRPNDEANSKETVLNDPRITPIGSFLRRTHIDELPQLINVIKGDMSMVGPRPHMLSHHKQFVSSVPFYNERHNVKPGITGLAQVKGYHGYIHDHYGIQGRTRLDLFYIKKVSFRLDMQIILKTFLFIGH